MRRHGSVLILTLFVLTVMSLTALSFAYRANLEGRSARDRAVRARLEAQASSALAIAMERLAENTNAFDHPAEPWHEHQPLSSETWLPEWSNGAASADGEFVCDYQVQDEQSKLNVAFASSDALQKLGLSAEQIDSFFDWIDKDDAPRAEGAETDYYRALNPNRRCKNGPLEMLDELLMIRGFDAAGYWGDPRGDDVPATQRRMAAASAPEIADRRLGWVDLLTCVGDGKINLNTAPRAVLRTLPLSDGAAEQILAFRAFDAGSSGNLEDHAFRSSQDVGQLQGLTAADRIVLAGATVFRSTHFRIFVQSRHAATGLRYHIAALVKCDEGQAPRILQWSSGG